MPADRRPVSLALALALLLGVASPGPGAHAAPVAITDLTLSATKGGAEENPVFAVDTPRIFLRASVGGADAGTRVRVSWIAEDVGAVAPPETLVDAVELELESGMNQIDSSISRPDAGWPRGDYRVDVTVAGEPAGSIAFRIE